VSSFRAGFEEKAGFFLDRISASPGFDENEERFCDLVAQYAGTTTDPRFKALLSNTFSIPSEKDR
jgi:hypothetical protein